MCETKNRDALRNGHKGDLGTIGLATADIIDALIGVQAQLKDIPTRSEVREMIHDSLRIHVETCDAARDDGRKQPESNKFKLALSKFGLERDEESDSVSVSGWVTEHFGRIPEQGEKFDYENLSVEVLKTDHRQVLEVQVTVLPQAAEEEEE